MGLTGSEKQNWKLFRERYPLWQEAYTKKLNQEYIALLQGKGSESDKFWKLEKRLRVDQRRAIFSSVDYSEMHFVLGLMLKEGSITMDDLEGFSESLKERVSNWV